MLPIIAANWKMHKTRHEVEEFFKILLPERTSASIWIAPSATTLHLASQKAVGTSIIIGAQNIYFEPQGAFTGEVSASQVADCGAQFVIIGHSERRRLFNETSPELKKKIVNAAIHQLTPLFCIGETLEQRKNHQTEQVLRTQLSEVLDEDFDGVVAYEPVWAIGTGASATPEMIEEAHEMCKNILKKLCEKGSTIPLLYGGSVTDQTAPQLSAIKNVDGVLVGGASLEAHSFISIIRRFKK
jgi:triosephosphate isomerase